MNLKKAPRIIISIISAIVFFSGSIFLSAFFANFAVNVQNVDVTLGSGESSTTEFVVSFDPFSSLPIGNEKYHIAQYSLCDQNEYDDYGNCINPVPNLCPYLSLELKDNEEPTPSPDFFGVEATGALNNPDDMTDNWNLSIKSPCFEGECPADYDEIQNGAPLPQSLKGQTFKCNLFVETNDIPVQVRNYLEKSIAYADTTLNTIEVSSVLTGETEQIIDPVIIIPGIMGSARKNGELVIDPILHTYDDLIATLKANGYEEGVDLFTFPYEWRNSNVLTANLLKDKIAEVKNSCECSKVDLIAHSMGGLAAREYIQSGQYQNDVDQVIFLGTPHKGSVDSYLTWEAGEFRPDNKYNFLIKIKFKAEAIKNGYTNLFSYIHNRPISSVQELLPTFDYLEDKDIDLLRTYPNNYPRNIFLEALNLDTKIQKLLDSGVEITNIVGSVGDVSTIEKIRVVSDSNPLWIDGKPDGFDGQTADRGLEKGSGDGTVTINGATLDFSIPNEIWADTEHQELPRETSARIFNLLTNKIADPVIFLAPIEKILSIQLQSPIDVVITAPDGKKIGKNFATGAEYNEIPTAFYSGFNNNDDEYITIPNPIDGEYKVEVQGTGNGGEYRVLSSYVSDTFAITVETIGITKPNQVTELNVSVDNQNPENLETERKITLEVLINDINGAYDLGWIKDKKTRDNLIKQANSIIKLEKKIDTITEKLPNGKKVQKRIERIEKRIDKVLARMLKIELRAFLKVEKINQHAHDLLKTDLEYLIVNN